MQAKESLILVQLNNSSDLLKIHLDQVLGCDNWPLLETHLLCNQLSRVDTEPVTDLCFPMPQRWWNIQPDLIDSRDKHSYSSLSSLALKPHAYTLQYAAKLSQGSILTLPVDNRLKGNLGHRIIELWFEQNPWDQQDRDISEIRAWLEAELDDIASRYALPLLAPGFRAQKLHFSDIMVHAIDKLLSHLADAGVVSLEIEATLNRKESFGELQGELDLLVQGSDGNFAVLDIKWGSEKRYRAEIKESRYLQLATYHRLSDSSDTPTTNVAYFILQSGNLLTYNRFVFPNAFVIQSDDESTSPRSVWHQFDNTIDWRLGQLSHGRVEVPYSGTEPDENSVAPDNAFAVVAIEQDELKAQSKNNGYKQTFKRIDPWRVLIGQTGE